MKSVAFYTLGCRLNFSETSALRKSFMDQEYDISSFEEGADIYVINTCSVTQDANRECRRIVRSALRKNPDAFVAVVGCYAQLEPQEIAAIDGVDLVLGAKEKFDIFDLVPEFQKVDKTIVHRSDVNEATDFHHALSSNDRTRAFLKVQDGCDYKCSFCTIPLARGKSRSPLIKDVVENARLVVSQGFKEVVLTGVNAGDFGRYNGETFYELLLAIHEIEGIERIRVSSIEPNLLEPNIIELAAKSDRFQPHFHLPLQSGSNEMLKIMRRRYRNDLYKERVELIRSLIPDACIGVDVITGHPGETDELFQESFDFIGSLPVSYLHVFTYSERPNTHALYIKPIIPKDVRKKRTHLLRRLSEKKRFDFDMTFKGQIRSVLFETDEKEGMMYGYTDNYIRVSHPYVEAMANKIIPTELDVYNHVTYSGKIALHDLVS